MPPMIALLTDGSDLELRRN